MYTYLEASRNFFKTGLLISPVVTGRLCLEFNYHMFGARMGMLDVYIHSQDAGETRILRIAGNRGDAWRRAELPLHAAGNYSVS